MMVDQRYTYITCSNSTPEIPYHFPEGGAAKSSPMEFSSGGGGGGASSGGDDPDSQRGKKRYHRHTAHQIQRLESMFKECPHPDEKTRNQLSRELNLHPRQIKFWFQNRRTQMKAQHERADNSALRSENDKIRCENIAIREALKNVICPSCGSSPACEDSYFDEQKLRIENAHLKEELDRVSSIAAKYIGRPISQLPPVQPIHVSSLDLSMASFGGHGMPAGPSLDLDLDLLHGSGSSSSVIPSMAFPPPLSISDMDKSLMADIAANAMDELIRLLQSNEPLWIKAGPNGREALNLESYERLFQSPYSHMKNPNVRIEASRDSGVVIMNTLALVDMFMDSKKWVELFPTIVSRAKTIEVISSAMLGSQSGTLQLMYEELQVLSALVPTRQLYFLRFCQQIEQGSWAVVDVSYEVPHHDSQFSCKAQRLPSGCLIQEMPNGYSKVTWVEHWEVEDKAAIHRLYRDLIHSGLAFGAERWLSSLQRVCERFACLMVSGSSTRDLGGVIPSAEGKRSMMKLAQRMVNNFCASINPANGQQWTTLSGMNEFEVRATLHKSTDPGQPSGVVLSAAATIWLPVPPPSVFNFFRDERTRPQWDVLSNQNPVQEVAHIANGSHPGNCISVLRAFNTSQNNMLILQESCIDSSGSLVVYCPVDLPAINMAMSGEDPSYFPLLPSGFTISPDGRAHHIDGGGGGADGASTSIDGGGGGGSLITVVFQILVSNLPSARLSPESVTTVNNLIGNTIHQIKAALNCNTTNAC
ncbi:homeodomain GLABROUS 11 [Perilla frutescens var. frutescens]|nr:homeodomain GLABROUS 11 [Perilla frutescens var. frutescens]